MTTYYTFDTENRLCQVKNGTTVQATFAYDGDGGRVKKIAGTTTTRYVGNLYEDTATATVKHIYLGSTEVASVNGSLTMYYHQDHLGGTNVTTDSSGIKKEVSEYLPFGGFSRHDKYGSSSEVAWFYFTGKKFDEETGLYYYGARYYDPSLGRFITADTIIKYPFNPQNLNRYSYAHNNPVNLIDPTGNFAWLVALVFIAKATIAGAAIGAAVGGVVGGIAAAIHGTNVWAGIGSGIINGAISGAATGFTFGAGTVGTVGLGIISPTTSATVLRVANCIIGVAAATVGTGVGELQSGGSFVHGAAVGAITATLTLGIGMTPIGAKIGNAISESKVGHLLNKLNSWVSESYKEFFNEQYAVKVNLQAVPNKTPDTKVYVQSKDGIVEGYWVEGQFYPSVSPEGGLTIPTQQGNVTVPKGYQADITYNKQGIIYRPPGSANNINSIRIMGQNNLYENGYVRQFNASGGGQPLNIYGKPGPDSSPETHFPLPNNGYRETR